MTPQEYKDYFFKELDQKIGSALLKRNFKYEEMFDFDTDRKICDQKWISNQLETHTGTVLQNFFCLMKPLSENIDSRERKDRLAGVDIITEVQDRKYAIQLKTSSNDENSSSKAAGNQSLLENAQALSALPVKASFKGKKTQFNTKIEMSKNGKMMLTYAEGTCYMFGVQFVDVQNAMREAWKELRAKYSNMGA